MTKRLTGINPLAYSGVEASTPPNSVQIRRAPTTQDFYGFNVGDIWINIAGYPQTLPTAEDIFYLVAKINHVATWVALAGTNALETLTGNTGGPVPGDANDNINIIGAQGIIVSGNPGTNTLTVTPNSPGNVASQFETDDTVIAYPDATGLLNVRSVIDPNGPGVFDNLYTSTPVAFGNRINVSLNSSIYQPNTNASGSTGMYSLGASANILTDRFLHNYGTFNTFCGQATGNTTLTIASAAGNTGIGALSLSSIVSGQTNTAIGFGSMQLATTARSSVSVGSATLQNMVSGFENVCVGNSVMGNSAVSGDQNTGVGHRSLFDLATGSANACLGWASGGAYTGAESYNIAIGYNTTGVLGDNNILRIGATAGAAQIAKSFIAGIRGITTDVNDAIPVLIDSAGQLGTVSSSLRFKENVKDMYDASSGIMRLRPTIFNYKTDEKKHTHYGLIAEEVLEVMPNLVVHDQVGPFTVKYNDLIPMLLNEIQKLNKRIEKLEKKKV